MPLLDENELQLVLGKEPGDGYANSDEEPIFRKKGIMIVVTL